MRIKRPVQVDGPTGLWLVVERGFSEFQLFLPCGEANAAEEPVVHSGGTACVAAVF